MASPFSFSAKVDSAQLGHLVLALDRLGKSGTKILEKATRRASGFVVRAAKANVKENQTAAAIARGVQLRDKAGRFLSIEERKALGQKLRTGLLRESLGASVRIYGRTVVAIVGPRRGFRRQIGVTLRAGKNPVGTPIYEDPSLIAHLVEMGHGGRNPAPPHPFLRPAWESTRDKCLSSMTDSIAGDIAKLARG